MNEFVSLYEIILFVPDPSWMDTGHVVGADVEVARFKTHMSYPPSGITLFDCPFRLAGAIGAPWYAPGDGRDLAYVLDPGFMDRVFQDARTGAPCAS